MRIANLKGRAVVVDEQGRAADIHDASQGQFGPDPQEIFRNWTTFYKWAKAHGPIAGLVAFDHSDLDAPVPTPRQVFAIGLNYAAHAAESDMGTPGEPSVFTKFPSSLAGPAASIPLPTDTVDWEVELVVVVGRECHRVETEDAWDYVAGLTVGQDISERTRQLAPPVPQFSLGKSFPAFSPIGPFVVTVDEMTDPDDLALECSLDGEVVQSGRTSQMIFSVPELIQRISAVVTLSPGDLIFTGTPSGVGHARLPRRYLRPGNVLESRIESVGRMVTPIVEGHPYKPLGQASLD